MTFGATLGVLGALCLVLGLIALAVRLVRGVAPRPSERLPMRVLSRVSVGAKQGVAAVQVGDRVLVVSVGDGGVRTLLEMDEVPPGDPLEAAPRNGAPSRIAKLASGDASALAGVAEWSWGLPGRGVARGSMGSLMRRIGLAGLVVLAAGAGLALGADPVMAQATAAQAAQAQGGGAATSQDALTALGNALPSMDLQVGDDEGLRLSGTVGTVLVIGVMTLLPTLLLLMTSFTRVLIILHFLRQALGTQTAPPAQMMAALALLLTGFIMAPTLGEVNETALKPWMDGAMDEAQMMSAAVVPFRNFMAANVRESDLVTFIDMSNAPAPETIDDVPLVTLISAFAISELRTAFQIGFVLFLPFLVIDLVVAAVLMSLGMFMLPPVMVSLPFKLLLFVLVDGWALIVHNVVASFG